MGALSLLISFTSLSAVFTAVRVYLRWRLRGTGADDILICLAFGANIGICTCKAVSITQYGLGLPKTEISGGDNQAQLQLLWLSLPFYHSALILTKLSALALYKRLFRITWIQISIWIVSIILVLSGLWIVLTAIFFCSPISAFWISPQTDRAKQCFSQKQIWLSNGVIQIVTHFIVLVLPLTMIPRLQLHNRQKLGLLILFGLGFVVVGIGIFQIITVATILQNHDLNLRDKIAGNKDSSLTPAGTDINLTHTLIHDDMLRLRTNTYQVGVQVMHSENILNGIDISNMNTIVVERTFDVNATQSCYSLTSSLTGGSKE
ncbi:hypothetical protein N7528_006857 [Penicillium herquei]|nr:hypothetical protein N7528_006857 [Penicillium herquei]